MSFNLYFRKPKALYGSAGTCVYSNKLKIYCLNYKRLLTGYAMHYNRRYERYGHLFQNRYKSIFCQEDTYFLELIRYIHLNTLRAELVANMKGLDRYAYSGHSVLMGKV